MAVLEIITPENETLRKKAHKINNFKDAKLQKLIDNMIETMMDAPGVGLAAPQVAISQRIIVVRLPDDEDSKAEYGDEAGVLYVVINPELARTSDDMVEGIEGCLSIPGVLGTVDRHEAVTIKGYDREGKKIRIKAKGWLARVFQHEIDHLEGVLFIDKANQVWQAGEEPLLEDDVEHAKQDAEAVSQAGSELKPQSAEE